MGGGPYIHGNHSRLDLIPRIRNRCSPTARLLLTAVLKVPGTECCRLALRLRRQSVASLSWRLQMSKDISSTLIPHCFTWRVSPGAMLMAGYGKRSSLLRRTDPTLNVFWNMRLKAEPQATSKPLSSICLGGAIK